MKPLKLSFCDYFFFENSNFLIFFKKRLTMSENDRIANNCGNNITNLSIGGEIMKKNS